MKKYPILILDDDDAILKALQETLRLEGYVCFGSTHGRSVRFYKKE